MSKHRRAAEEAVTDSSPPKAPTPDRGRNPRDLLTSLAERGRVADEHAARTDDELQSALAARQEAEARVLARGGDRWKPWLDEMQQRASAALSLPPEELETVLQRFDHEARGLTTEEQMLRTAVFEAEGEAEKIARHGSTVYREVDQWLDIEQRSRARAIEARELAERSAADLAVAHDVARREALTAQLAARRADAAMARVEELSVERAALARMAIEHGALEEEASVRTSAALRAAQQLAAQRVAAERALESQRSGYRIERSSEARAGVEVRQPVSEPSVGSTSETVAETRAPARVGTESAEPARAASVAPVTPSTSGWVSRLVRAEQGERAQAAAELARVERVASERADATRRARATAEVERPAAADVLPTRWPARTPASGLDADLYAEAPSTWEAKAQAGVQRRAAIEEERRVETAASVPAVEPAPTFPAWFKPAAIGGVSAFAFFVVAMLLLSSGGDDEGPAAPVSSGEAAGRIERPEPIEPTSVPPIEPTPTVAATQPTVTETEPAVRETVPVALPPRLEPVPSDGNPPAWRRYAVAAADPRGKPMIALVIDDMGKDVTISKEVIDLPAPLTVSFFPFAPKLEGQAEEARRRGHELMAHIPMEPQANSQDPGPNALRVAQSPEQSLELLRLNLDRFGFGVVGMNNHMGSLLTAREDKMRLVMEELRKRRMMFLDSHTTRASVGAKVAERYGLPFTINDLFLDNVLKDEEIWRQLDEVEVIARRNGSAVAIGHPYAETVRVVRKWIKRAEARGFVLVPVTTVVEYQMRQRAARDLRSAAITENN